MEPTTPVRHRRADRYKETEPAPGEGATAGGDVVSGGLRAEPAPRPAALRLPREQTPPEPMARPKPPPRPVQTGRERKREASFPTWLTITLCVLLLVAGALFAGECLMRAYLTQRQEARAAAYQRVVEAHPLDYRELIERYAAENNLNPAFVASIILNESSYRTDAQSRVGARGLMQLMEDTAGWIAGKLDVQDFNFEMMYDAETNIRFGTWYLGYLGKLFRGDPVLVACAFHAGQGEVRSWLSDPDRSMDGMTLQLDQLPDGPTKTYAGRVNRDYGIYQALYFTPDPPVDGTGPVPDPGTVGAGS